MNTVVSFNEQYELFTQQFSKEHIVLKFNNREVCKDEFEKMVTFFISKLVDLGVRKGMGIGYTMPNTIEIMPLFIAISRIGAYAVPMFYSMPDRMKVSNFKQVGVRFVITTDQQLESLIECTKEIEAHYTLATIDKNNTGVYSFSEPLYKQIDVDEYILKEKSQDLVLMVDFSLESTGTTKFVYMTQGNIGEEINLVMNRFEVDERTSYVSNCIVFDLCTSTLLVLMSLVFKGSKIIYSDDLTPVNYLKLIEENQPEQLLAPAKYFEELLQTPNMSTFDLSSLKCIGMGRDVCSEILIKRLKEKLPSLQEIEYICNFY